MYNTEIRQGVRKFDSCILEKIKESDLDFLACSASRLTRNHIQIEFGGISIPKEQVQWNKEQ
jgi:hypothetical protein